MEWGIWLSTRLKFINQLLMRKLFRRAFYCDDVVTEISFSELGCRLYTRKVDDKLITKIYSEMFLNNCYAKTSLAPSSIPLHKFNKFVNLLIALHISWGAWWNDIKRNEKIVQFPFDWRHENFTFWLFAEFTFRFIDFVKFWVKH